MKFSTSIINRQVKFFFSHQSKKKYFFKVEQGKPSQEKAILPSQYPQNLTDLTPAIKRGRPVRYITPKHQIPEDKFVQNSELVIAEKYNGKWKSPDNSYALNIGLIGPVNSGKSQLLGKIMGKKLSAISPKANTTTQTIEGFKSLQIQSEEQGLKNVQLKFYDTAGLMYKKTGFISKGWKVLSEIDFSLLVIDSTKRFDQMTKQSIKRLQMHRNYQNFMKALVLNKIDLIQNRRKFHSLIGQVQKYGKFDRIFYVSALTGYGVQQLQDYLIKMAKKRQWEQPKQVQTNLTQIQIYEEMMKQCVYHRSYKQVPYNVTIQCISSAMKSNFIEQIKFKFTVQTENQQRMIIGGQGRNLKWMIDRFKVYFTQAYKRQAEAFVEVRIRKKTNQNQYLSQQNMFDQETQQRFYKQKIAVVEEYLGRQGKFRKENMLQWKQFLNNKVDQAVEGTPQLTNNSQIQSLPQNKSKRTKKRTLTKSPNRLRRK